MNNFHNEPAFTDLIKELQNVPQERTKSAREEDKMILFCWVRQKQDDV
jgi:hypothetical protein